MQNETTSTTNEEVSEIIMTDNLHETEIMMEEEELTLYPSSDDLQYPDETFKLELDYMDNKLQEDKLWKARTGLNENSICGAIETIVFMSDKPVPLMKIKSLIDEDMPLRIIHEAIERLQSEYESSHHGIRLQEVAQGYQFRTKATYSKYVQDLFKINELVLSPTALEVLAIIAYKQPVSKVEVEKIRGVDSSHIVRGLMDKRLVKVVGRSEEIGKPVLYGTTLEFLEVFNLSNTDQLPPEHELQEIAKNSVGNISEISGLVNADLRGKFDQDALDELDQLSLSIKAIDSETAFTKSLKIEEKKRIRGESQEEVKTAFDLLEEYLDKSLVLNSNLDSVDSELFSAVTNPLVIGNLTQGPFNVPEEEEEEEPFEMIDLDTGEVIREEDFDSFIDIELEDEDGDIEFELDITSDDAEFEKMVAKAKAQAILEDAQEQFQEDKEIPKLPTEGTIDISNEVETEEKVEVIDLLGSSEDEAKSLAAALDDAFSKLLGEESLIEETPLDASAVTENLDEQTDKMIESAKDLDLDLSFMNDFNTDEKSGEEFQ